jgi:hypothetical protein
VLKSLPGPVLGIFGGADASIPLEEVTHWRMVCRRRAFRIRSRSTMVSRTPLSRARKGFNLTLCKRAAWNEMLEFLDANLKSGSARLPREAGLDYSAPFPWQYYAMLVFEHAFGSGSRH